MAGAVEVGPRRCAAVDRDDYRARFRHPGDQCGHGHGADHDDAWARVGAHVSAHDSVRNRMAPLGVSPPLLTTATWASATWRSPASPRSWLTASWIRPMPWVRPCES